MTSDEQMNWEPWQEEYRYGAFYLFPPPEIALVVNELRLRYDPRSAAICDAHVSLSEPLTGPLLDQQLDEILAANYRATSSSAPAWMRPERSRTSQPRDVASALARPSDSRVSRPRGK